MAKIKQFQRNRRSRQKAAQDQFVAALFIRVEKQGTKFEAAGSIIDVANGLLTAASKNKDIRLAFLMAAHQLGKSMELNTVDDYKTAAIELSQAITEQSTQATDQTEEE
jgi:hypothetical protein